MGSVVKAVGFESAQPDVKSQLVSSSDDQLQRTSVLVFVTALYEFNEWCGSDGSIGYNL